MLTPWAKTLKKTIKRVAVSIIHIRVHWVVDKSLQYATVVAVVVVIFAYHMCIGSVLCLY